VSLSTYQNLTVLPTLYQFLNRVDPGGGLLQSFSGLSLDNGADEALSVAIIESSAGVGAHELGHSMGLRYVLASLERQ
jgi:hypothetical protein